MKGHRLVLLAVALMAALAVTGCGGDDDEEGTPATTEETTGGGGGGGTTLNGSVGPGFEISLEGTDGLTAGDYTIVVNDQATTHNFHLTGPGGVDVKTDVGAEGEESFDVTLEPGEYTYVCDPHASSMKGTFTVS